MRTTSSSSVADMRPRRWNGRGKRWRRLGLTLNETKTCLRRAWEESFDFLGYTFGVARSWDQRATVPGSAAVEEECEARRRTRIAEVLHRGNMDSILGGRSEPEPHPRMGWRNYFSYGSRRKAYRVLDHYVSKRARSFLRRRHKLSTRGTRRFSDEAHLWPRRHSAALRGGACENLM